ncbi:hypothetical protein B0H13DRAFT_2303813 [Mycena leptocephala]|nr:hypothetical protein B0H13DRAFT_2303813 [Mycena leptocephala]
MNVDIGNHQRPGPFYAPPGEYSNNNDLIAKLDAMALRQDRLEERNQELEAIIANYQRASPSVRDGAPSRGTSRQHKKQVAQGRARGARNTPDDSDEPDHVPASEPESEVEPEPEPQSDQETDQGSVSLGIATKDLKTPELKHAREAEVSLTFRQVIGVPGAVWPDLSVARQNEGTVATSANVRLITAVAKQVKNKLGHGPTSWPIGLAATGVTVKWDPPRAHRNGQNLLPLVQGKLADSGALSTYVQIECGIAKAERRGRPQVIAAFAAKYKASGPEEDDSETGKAVWKTKIVFKSDRGHLDDAALALTNFLEVLVCAWRSGELTGYMKELSKFSATLEPTVKPKIQYVRVPDTGRVSPRISEIAPFNFGINQTWFALNKKKSEYALLLHDWGLYKDLEGFGGNRAILRAEDGAVAPVDSGRADEDLSGEH